MEMKSNLESHQKEMTSKVERHQTETSSNLDNLQTSMEHSYSKIEGKIDALELQLLELRCLLLL